MTKAIKAQIRELRAEMKLRGIRKVCTMNRVDAETFRYNMRLERLQLDLERANKGA